MTKHVDETHIRYKADEIKERGEIFMDHYDLDIANNPDVDRSKRLNLTLGDERIPHGLWKSIEHMRRGERARIMVKPRWAYYNVTIIDKVVLPRGWDAGERLRELRSRRVFFDVKLHDWVTRHDINGDGLLIKTIHRRGGGFDRPTACDEVLLDLKMHQKNGVVHLEYKDKTCPLKDKKQIPATVRTILEAMKTGEKASVMVQPAHFLHYDRDLRGLPPGEGGYPEIDEDQLLLIDVELKGVVSITDVYRDGSAISKILKKVERGSAEFSTASPFADSKVAIKLKLEVGETTVFDNLSSDVEDAKPPFVYDMDEYQLPAVLRRVLKVSKLREVVELITTRPVKVLDSLEDVKHQLFSHPEIRNMPKHGKPVKMTFELMGIDYKSHPSKLPIAERVVRLNEMRDVSMRFLKRALEMKMKSEEELTPLDK